MVESLSFRRAASLLFFAAWLFCEVSSAHRIVAIGDLHGDVENAREILRLAQVIDDAGRWATGRDTVIQMGDVVDRGPHGHTIFDMLAGLAVQARAAGGELIQLLGNHELMNFQGDAKFVAPELLALFGGAAGWKREFAAASGRYGSAILERPTVAVRNHTLFVHAGVTAAVAALGPVHALNDRMRKLMTARQFADPLLLDGGPVWTRGIIYPAQVGNCEPLYAALQEINRQERLLHGTHYEPIRRMVVGHTIQPNGAMRSFCNNSLFAIDVCISQYMQTGGHLAHLEVRPKPPAAAAAGPGPGDDETVWFYYPPVPDAKHALHHPVLAVSSSSNSEAEAPVPPVVLGATKRNASPLAHTAVTATLTARNACGLLVVLVVVVGVARRLGFVLPFLGRGSSSRSRGAGAARDRSV